MLGSLRSSNGNRQGGLSRKFAANAGASWRERGGWRAYAKSRQRHKRDSRIRWSCPPVLCADRDRARASGGRKKLKGATLTSSRIAPSDRAGPGWVAGWRLELADHLVAVRSLVTSRTRPGSCQGRWGAQLERNAPAGESVNRPSRFGKNRESRV